MQEKDLKSIQASINQGELSVTEIVAYYLAKIADSDDLNIYIEVFADEALSEAKALDERIASGGSVGKLYGSIISIKDVICYQNHHVTAGSKILEGFKSQFTATALQRLLDEDAIVIGRTNCDEFAMGSANENSAYGVTPNGVDPERVAGGSSGASAVSVQQDTCLIALGTDTGGSVRQPAGFNGVIGMKPTYGRVSRYGVIAYGSSFDQIGVMGHHVRDVGMFLLIMSGEDPMDCTSSSHPVLSESESIDEASFAYIDDVMTHEKLNDVIKDSSHELIDTLKGEGHRVDKVQFPLLQYLVPTYYVLTTAEASSNLGRYDGIRYGYRSKDADSIKNVYQKTRSEGFGSEVKRRIMLGTFVLSSGYYDAYYTKAQKVRRLVTEAINIIFEHHDFLILPTTPNVAWKIGAHQNDPVEVYLSDIYTVIANLTGVPAISLPLGTDSDGNPFGIQLMSKKFSEAKLTAVSEKILTR